MLNEEVSVNETVEFEINITNLGNVGVDEIWLYDDFNSTFLNFTNQSNCNVSDYGDSLDADDDGYIDINVSSCLVATSGTLPPGNTTTIYLNFTAITVGISTKKNILGHLLVFLGVVIWFACGFIGIVFDG